MSDSLQIQMKIRYFSYSAP